ncbi:MAG: molybdopterin-dependent oxidoreductase [Eubacteriales bacterium]|nr:molybdopterin-dependent oxidoreductase [Eubacteriales bacterium]MDD4583313.1 molybdopterin-dependent oxidoreductase [Eubacteriales bacterium]
MSDNVRKLRKKDLIVNGVKTRVIVEPNQMLSTVIREQLGLLGTKVGCKTGQCGICSVIVNGKVVRSCITKMSRVPDNAQITTIEGIGTRDNLHPLQAAMIKHGAAQCGFCSPGFIVSGKALLDENQNPTREEIRDWFQKHRNVCRCTGYKPIVDAVMDAAKVIRKEWTIKDLEFDYDEKKGILGSYAPRPNAVDKVVGTHDFGADVGLKMPKDTLQMALVQAKVSHANIKSIDTSVAEKMPGVEAVLTHKDIKGTNRINGMALFPWNKGDGFDRPILCDEKIFMYGDAIAIVCADTKEHAEAAADAVIVDIEELPAYMNALEAMADDAIEIHPGTPNVYFDQKTIKGEDTAAIFKEAAYTTEASYYTTRQPHLILEPDVGFGYFDENDMLTIQSKSICLYVHIAMLQEALGIPEEKFRIIQNNTGATFGYKLSPTNEALIGVAVMATGKPCYLEFDMHQTITYTGKRASSYSDIKMAADKDGKILGMEYDLIFDHGAYSEWGDCLAFKGNMFVGAGYDIKNIRGETHAVCTNHTYGTAFRSYGSPQALFPSECLIDELAVKMGMDPFDLRYKNIYRPGATSPVGDTPEVFSLEEMMDYLKPHYEQAKKEAKKKETADKKYGVGLSLANYCVGGDFADFSEAWAELLPDGGVAIYNCWQDHGQGSDLGTLTIAHEALKPLNVPINKIKMIMNDTKICPDGGVSAGSRGQVFFGNAMKDACEKLISAMKKEDGSYRTYEEMVVENIDLRYVGSFASGQFCQMIDQETAQGIPMLMYMYGFIMTELCVNINTGKVTVNKMTLVTDCGKIINKSTVDGQMYGGLVQGVGFALTEQYEDLKKHTSLAGCGIPTIKDAPDEMEVIYFENPREHGPFGASGVGELPLSSPHASIINAIYDACNVRIRELPALPEKILAELKK